MRTTLTLDEDVAALLRRLRRERGATLKAIANEALRRGLDSLARQHPAVPPAPYTEPVSMRPLVADVDDVAAVLAMAEGDSLR